MERRAPFNFSDIKWSENSTIEEFKKSIPHFCSLANDVYYLTYVPNEVWSELEGLINRKPSTPAAKARLINKIASVVPCESTNNWGEPFLTEDVKQIVRKIKKKTDDGHLEAFMNCLACLVNSYDDVLSTNDFLKEHEIGYMLIKAPGTLADYKWALLDSDIIRDDIQPRIDEVKSTNKQAYEEFKRAKELLKEPTSDRIRKDILNSCLSAMEAIIKEYGRDNDIDNATSFLQNTHCYGSPKLVRGGKTIFHNLQEEYPDIRHGTQDCNIKEILSEEMEYWLRRIVAFSIYLMQRGEKIRRVPK